MHARRLEGPARLVTARRRADGDHRQPLGPCHRLPGRSGVEPDEGAHADRNLLALDSVDPGPVDDHVHLFLPRLRFVVLAARGVRWQLEPVDAEGPGAELPPDEANRSAGRAGLDVVDVDDREAHAETLPAWRSGVRAGALGPRPAA